MKRILLLTSVVLPTQVFAQEGIGAAVLVDDTNFFICVVAGVLLALGFQLFLTALSVAGGITAVGNIREKMHSGNKHAQTEHSHYHEDHEGMNVGQKVSTGLGLWTLITTSVALFFASLLAVKLGLTGINFIGASLGLVIWAAFFMIVTYLEVNMVSSLVGGLVSTVKHSLSSASSVFSKSEESISKDVAKTKAKEEAKQMRKQFEKLFSSHHVDRKIEDYVKELKPQKIDIHKLKKEIKDLLMDIQVTEKADFDYPNSVKKMILEEADKSSMSKEDKEAIKEHVHSLKDIAGSDASREEKAKQGIEQLTSADREKIDEYQEKITAALRNSNKEELQPEKLEEDLRKILQEPGQASNVIKAKASAMDRDTLVKILSSQNMTEQEAEKRVSQAEKVLDKISTFFSNGQDQGSKKKAQLQHKKDDLQSKVKSMFGGAGTDLNRVYSDFVHIFRDSGDGPELKYKLKHYNQDEMTAMLVNQTSMSRADAEPVAAKIVAARDNVMEKAMELEIKVNEKMAEAKEKTIIAAEESRKAAATAAWWLVATAVVSAAASAAGGMLALEGIF